MSLKYGAECVNVTDSDVRRQCPLVLSHRLTSQAGHGEWEVTLPLCHNIDAGTQFVAGWREQISDANLIYEEVV